MDFDDDEPAGFGYTLPPALVSLTPFAPSVSSSPRRLSSCFTQPSKPVRAKRQLAWLSLQGRLVGAEEATSSKSIDANALLTAEEAVAWDLFTPIQRVLIVSVIAAAATNSRKDRDVLKLQKSVELRDQVLLSMQQKLDSLCKAVYHFKDQPEIDLLASICQKPDLATNYSQVDGLTKELYSDDDVFQHKVKFLCETEPEERRLSDLSDWAPSVTSSVDFQFDASANEPTLSTLRKECEEKDAIIKELSSLVQSSKTFGAKRISELEEIIRRKNMIINKLRKDTLILEQKVVSLTRLGRASSSYSNLNVKHSFPFMVDNVLYDMDNSTTGSSSSSDSDDDAPENQKRVPSLKGHENSVHISEECSKEKLKNDLSMKNKTPVGGENRSRKRAPRPHLRH